ncbi:hypothetical protein CGRA01v4_06582 [Colletotrichum graminicola]|uniref:Uncharacterized protein n=1 Tax=Colletotrichum graminicola (strain M1.001 / M2 / FGSC 10212) TaxID=645133 RepID=E3Q1Z3_COLGM|nr:uncharacterized protein GLRG_00238 [Colletotrichum graminicola M1.001]EFQ25094.1 hypothetical protein GLRG_00238 [Colletotrichum graminicola M1.001]WDK15301.1 hypothetical protein CGRA01v4_06582 [Colletotrichum graminicola]
MTLAPPPPYPPPTSNSVHIHPLQQQSIPEPQYAPVPIPAAYNQAPNHTGSQQHPPTPVQQGYPPTPQLYQPQPYQPRPLAQQQTQQQQQQQPNLLPTPISPPCSVNVVEQACSSYFPATMAPQKHAVYNPQDWAGRPYGQEPYTPAATPSASYSPQTAQAYSSHPQWRFHDHDTVVTPMILSRQVIEQARNGGRDDIW